MTPIRILLVDLPTLLRDILAEALASESDMEVVGSALTRAELIPLWRQFTPNVVVVGAERDDAATLAHDLRAAAPAITVVAIAPKGDRAIVFSRHSAPVVLSDVSSTSLIMAIRDYSDVNGSTKFPPGRLS